MNIQQLEAELGELSEWLVEQIDGGTECQGRDSQITHFSNCAGAASRLLAVQREHIGKLNALIEEFTGKVRA